MTESGKYFFLIENKLIAFGKHSSLAGNTFLGISNGDIFHRFLGRTDGLRDTLEKLSLSLELLRWLILTFPRFFSSFQMQAPLCCSFGCPLHKNLLSIIAQKMITGLILCNFPAFVKTAATAYGQKITRASIFWWNAMAIVFVNVRNLRAVGVRQPLREYRDILCDIIPIKCLYLARGKNKLFRSLPCIVLTSEYC